MTYLLPSERTQIEVSGNYKYIGTAASGTLTSEPFWQIVRFTMLGNEVTAIDWADGNQSPDNIWDDRATKAYS